MDYKNNDGKQSLMCLSMSRVGVCALPIILLLLLTKTCFAGAYILERINSNTLAPGVTPGTVVHPTGYQVVNGQTTASGAELKINVCVDSTSLQSFPAMETPILNVINTYNALAVTTANIITAANSGIGNLYDFESVALHELGHCLGLGHPNLGNATGVSLVNSDFTNSLSGTNSVYSFNSGSDGLKGSRDDIRDDDINLTWFAKATNDPFAILTPVDSNTYSNNINDLPTNANFPANANRDVYLQLYGAANNTEAVMVQGAEIGEIQRSFAADDVISLRYAMSGLDEIQGTNDDYTFWLNYIGATDTDCDVKLQFQTNQNSIARSEVPTVLMNNSTHRKVSRNIGIGNPPPPSTPPSIKFDGSAGWHFNPTDNTDTLPDDPTGLAQLMNVDTNTTVQSETFIVSGINVEIPISISGNNSSVYSIERINNGSFTSANGVVRNGDNITVQHTSSPNFDTAVTSTLTIGDRNGNFIQAEFISTTRSSGTVDTKPNNFAFTNQSNVPLSSEIISNSVAITGINAATTISVTNGEYSVNGGNYTTATGLLNNGNSVSVRHTSSQLYASTNTTELVIGGVAGNFNSTTISDPTTVGGGGSADDGGGSISFPILLLLFLTHQLIKLFAHIKTSLPLSTPLLQKLQKYFHFKWHPFATGIDSK